jgi:hypothetical protein
VWAVVTEADALRIKLLILTALPSRLTPSVSGRELFVTAGRSGSIGARSLLRVAYRYE